MASGWASALGAAGCGDPPLCQSDVFVAFQQTMITTDGDALAPGVQTDLHLRTSLRAGEVVTLEVFDGDGTPLGALEGPAAADGSVVFTGVSVPTPRVALRATGRGLCGEGTDEIAVDVLSGAPCTVALEPAPESNAYYAPLGVLSQSTDPDPATPGYQTTVRVMTHPGWSVEIFRTTTSEQSLGSFTAGKDGVAIMPVTVLDGQVEFRAACRGGGTELASKTIAVLADTTAPTCDLVYPMPGVVITPESDQDRDVTNGLQIAIAAHAGGTDVADEPAMLMVAALGDGSPIALSTPVSAADAGGMSTASVVLPSTTPADYEFTLRMRDHAGNTCTIAETYTVMYDDSGCPISMTAPAAPVTHDADGDGADGSQVDITLAVGGSCAGQTVTATCGGSPSSGSADREGNLTLRTDVCTTSPCQVDADCVFQVKNAIGIPSSTTAHVVFDDVAPVTSLVAAAAPGKGIRLSWTSPDHVFFNSTGPPVAYLLKSAPVPLTDANFDATGTVEATNSPSAPGTQETLDISSAPVGVMQYYAIAALDGAGHRSAVASTGPITASLREAAAVRAR